MTLFFEQAQKFIASTFVTIGSPILGASVGVVSFYEKIIPPLTILSLVVGIVLGILSYKLKLKQSKNKTDKL